MWPPPAFAVDDPAELEALLAAVRFGSVVTHGPDGMAVTHMPLIYHPEARVLRGHMAAGNPQAQTPAGTQAIVLFRQMDAYVTPAFYPSKAEHGKVAPTWNYEFVHVRGPVSLTRDPVWLRQNVSDLTDRNESSRAEPWKVDDAPEDYVQRMMTMIVGMEIAIEQVECRRKFSQNRNAADRRGVIEGLSASDDPDARTVAAAMRASEPE